MRGCSSTVGHRKESGPGAVGPTRAPARVTAVREPVMRQTRVQTTVAPSGMIGATTTMVLTADGMMIGARTMMVSAADKMMIGAKMTTILDDAPTMIGALMRTVLDVVRMMIVVRTKTVLGVVRMTIVLDSARTMIVALMRTVLGVARMMIVVRTRTVSAAGRTMIDDRTMTVLEGNQTRIVAVRAVSVAAKPIKTSLLHVARTTIAATKTASDADRPMIGEGRWAVVSAVATVGPEAIGQQEAALAREATRPAPSLFLREASLARQQLLLLARSPW